MDEFVQQLLREQGVPEDLDPAVRSELVVELTNRVTDFLNRRLIDAMSDQAVEQFNAMLESDTTDATAVQNFIAENVPDKQRVAAAALTEFRSLYLGDKA